MLDFIANHHVLSLASSYNNKPSSCSVFYAFMEDEHSFIFASQNESEHIQNIMKNSDVSASIHEETREVLLIKGLQIKGAVRRADPRHEDFYVHVFSEAKEVKKEIWVIRVSELKLTDNKNIGFGQKEIWKG